MPKLRWNDVGQRFYETGLDRGVLYLADRTGVPWSGLTSVEEDLSEDSSEPLYFDGIKYMDAPAFGDYSATLSAFTYPDEFLEYEGIVDLGSGLFVDGQDSKLFGLSYRTRVGNDTEGPEHGYKIHLVYNLTAIPSDVLHETLMPSSNVTEFSWTISGIPEGASGYRPTAHVIFDSRDLPVAMLAGLEDILYGDADSTAHLPTINELIDFVSFFDPKRINANTVTGLATLTSASGDLTQTKVAGVYSALPSTRLVQTGVSGFYQLQP